MRFLSETDSPLGKIILASDGSSLTGLWFFDQKNALRGLQKDAVSKDLIVFEEAKKWLKIYFSGKEPDFRVPLSRILRSFSAPLSLPSSFLYFT